MKKRILSTLPLISLFILFLLGFGFKNWRLGILTAILIFPLFNILLSSHIGKRLYRQMPFISLILFLWFWLGLGKAHPGWLIFFLVPISNIIYHRRFTPRKMVFLIIFSLYVLLGFIYPLSFFPESLQIVGSQFWHPGWVILLLIPIINNIFFPNTHTTFSFKVNDFKQQFKDYIKSDDFDE